MGDVSVLGPFANEPPQLPLYGGILARFNETRPGWQNAIVAN